eukprot:14694000-Ditylum_brightwellii.AAC.1
MKTLTATKSTPHMKEKVNTITPPVYKDAVLQPKPNSFLLLKKCREVNELRMHSNNSQSTGEVGSSHRTLHKVQLGIWVPANRNNYEEHSHIFTLETCVCSTVY